MSYAKLEALKREVMTATPEPATPPAIELKPYQAAVQSNTASQLMWDQPDAFKHHPITGADRLLCRMVITLIDAYADLSRVTQPEANCRHLSLAAISDRIKLCMGIPMDSTAEYITPADLDAVWQVRSPTNRDVIDFNDWLYAIRRRIQGDDPLFPWNYAGEMTYPIMYDSVIRPGQSPEDVLRYFAFDWQLREAFRVLILNTAGQLPWAKDLAPIAGHYAHLNDDGQVRFTPDATKGERAVHVLMKPGRYLRKNYPALSNETIEAWQAKVDAANVLHFARTSEEIVAAYESGPSSCMAYKADHFQSGHPCRVYGSGSDVTLAYLKDASGKITARTLVWEAKKIWCRMYGDHQRLKAKLERLGYTQGELTGAKIHRIKAGGSRDMVVMPYIDLVLSFGEYDDEWLVIGGDRDAASISGVSSLAPLCTCTYCDEIIDEDAARTTPDGDHACESCFDDRFATCDRTGAVVVNDDIVEVVVRYWSPRLGGYDAGYEFWSRDAIEDNAFYCDRTDEYHSADRFTAIKMHDGTTWNSHAFAHEGYTAKDGENYPLGEGPGTEDDAEDDAAAA